MRAHSHILRIFLLNSAFLWVLSSCAAPTLPLPPPAALVEGPPQMGLVTVSGTAQDGAFISCLNENTEEGVIRRANDMGEFRLQLEASSGDELRVWQHDGAQTSTPIWLSVP